MVAHVPSPADFVHAYTARELLAEIHKQHGRVYRMIQPPIVFCLTDSQELATWLLDMGGKLFRPVHMPQSPRGGYERTRGGLHEWDIVIHTIEVEGEETLWEALA